MQSTEFPEAISITSGSARNPKGITTSHRSGTFLGCRANTFGAGPEDVLALFVHVGVRHIGHLDETSVAQGIPAVLGKQKCFVEAWCIPDGNCTP